MIRRHSMSYNVYSQPSSNTINFSIPDKPASDELKEAIRKFLDFIGHDTTEKP